MTVTTSKAAMSNRNIPLHFHTQMLADPVRMAAFRETISRIVKPGQRVLELGGGTGVLSCWAAQRGASVTCVESRPELVAAARSLLRQNPGGDLVTLIEADPAEYMPETPVDIVICELLHAGLLHDKQLAVMDQFRQHHLEKFGKLPRFIPDTTMLAVQPVQQNFNLNGFTATMPLFQNAYAEQGETQPLGEAVIYSVIEYHEPQSYLQRAEIIFEMTGAGELNALRFITKNLLAIIPEDLLSVDWHNSYLIIPLSKPVQVKAGDRVLVSFSYLAGAEIQSLQQCISTCALPAGDISVLFNGEEVDIETGTAKIQHA